MKLLHSTTILFLFGFALIGCASKEPTFGDNLKSEGRSTEKLGKQWEEGQGLVSKGNKLQKKGKKQIKDGRENIEKGEFMVKKGRRLIREAEEEALRRKRANSLL